MADPFVTHGDHPCDLSIDACCLSRVGHGRLGGRAGGRPTAAMSTYQGAPGGPRDPETGGPYCLAICRCGTCPQHAKQQAAADLLREQEWSARDRRDGERAARRNRRAA